MDINYVHIRTMDDLYLLKRSLDENDLTIDAIFGIGLTRDIQGLYFEVISFINNYSKKIISVDIPSGLQCDTGDILSIAVKAEKKP